MGNFLDKHFGRLGNRCFQSFYIYAQMREGKIPDIFLQDYKYFDKYINEFRGMIGEIPYINNIGVHIRLGKNPSNPDEPAYSENPFYTNLTRTDYYEKAMSMFPREEFLIFSDDIKWCQENLEGNNLSFSDGTEEQDFMAMLGCKSLIIANSSFSHICAILNPNPNKQIIAPIETKYYSDNIVRSKFPKDFIQIDFKKNA